jgi:lactoylglutathione lyase
MMIEHIALWTHDLEKLKTFYERYFGARANDPYHNPKKQFRSYFLSFDSGARLELMQRPDIADRAEGEVIGYAHLAVSVGSKVAVDSLSEQLRADGHRLIDGPRTTGDGYYECVVQDPDGNRIEVTL